MGEKRGDGWWLRGVVGRASVRCEGRVEVGGWPAWGGMVWVGFAGGAVGECQRVLVFGQGWGYAFMRWGGFRRGVCRACMRVG